MTDYTVLVADDERSIADLYTRWLGEEYDVYTAYDGAEAIEYADDSIDIALLDRDMPRASGDDVLETIRERQLDCRVGMITAAEPDFDVLELGYDDYIVKPIRSPEQLHNIVTTLTQRATYSADIQRLLTLSSKQAALETRMSPGELESRDEYQELIEEVQSLKASLSDTLDGLGDDDLQGELMQSHVASE
ncbi:HalX domain-containing protein [Haladaptatus litoreus]|uniref:HalX domain-containing protein n=1 Tax=Haladaptatus litoreus TaxID=553468 RepID=A0A1N6VSV4_9EURY|nr:response regulator [Haladaptatus litoreus]SIQ80706.1 HalX domain-containing protein [Haladaptatus litoreus]